jgi:4'-phosphopantetheinyl transferase
MEPGECFQRADSPHPHILIGWVHIPTWLSLHLPAAPKNYRRRPAAALSTLGFDGRFLPSAEGRQADRFRTLKRQVEWLCGRYALQGLLRTAGGNRLPVEAAAVAYETHGAPYLPARPRWTVSLSHAGDYAVAGLTRRSGIRFGLDVECIGSLDMEAVQRVAFHRSESRRLRSRPVEEFFRCWTVKEAFLKYRRIGFSENLKQVQVGVTGIVYRGRTLPGVEVCSGRIDRRHVLTVVYTGDSVPHP